MIHDDAHTSHNHGFELPTAPDVVVRSDPRPWRAVAGVAVCLGLAGIVTGLIVARRQSVSDEHITSDALQREELRDGWKALGVAAVRDAQQREDQLREEQTDRIQMPANTANPAPAPNVVIVNVPTPNPSAAPAQVTNINVPSGSTKSTDVSPSDNWNYGSGYAPNQSVPSANYTPVQGYVPVQGGYPLPPNTSTYGTGVGSVAPSVGNGTIPGSSTAGSSTNSALPNGGLVGSSPTTGPTSGSNTNNGATPSAPMGTTTVSPSTPSLPSGFSAP